MSGEAATGSLLIFGLLPVLAVAVAGLGIGLVAHSRQRRKLEAAQERERAKAAKAELAARKPPKPARDLEELRVQARHAFMRHEIDFYFPAFVDYDQGGFHEHSSGDANTPDPRTERSLVFQCRLIWTLSRGHAFLPEQRERFAELIRHGADFVLRTFPDTEAGGYWPKRPLGNAAGGYEPRPDKHAYPHAMLVFALAAAGRVLREPRYVEAAREAFEWIETHARDQVHGGYCDALGRDGSHIMDAGHPDAHSSGRDDLGLPYGVKSVGLHLHLLEAYAELYRTWPEPKVRERMLDLLDLLRQRMTAASGTLHLFLAADLSPLPDWTNYGHNLEVAHLYIDAAETLGLQGAAYQDVLQSARRLVDYSVHHGWDQDHGGFYSDGGTMGSEHREKIWWIQAEALAALHCMDRVLGAETGFYRGLLLRQWKFVWRHQLDQIDGNWFATLEHPSQQPIPGPKVYPWKANYHTGRALLALAGEWP